jgi:hypothetical protein
MLKISIRTDTEGHWVEWRRGEEKGTLGPYVDREIAENVKAAKERELTGNTGHINDAR